MCTTTVVFCISVFECCTETCLFQVVSVKLDEWTDEQVDILADSGGNTAVNMIYEAFMPEKNTKPSQDCSAEERSDFIRYILTWKVIILLI
jgi:hypothetical protein